MSSKIKITNKVDELKVLNSSYNPTTRVITVNIQKVTPVEKIKITIKRI